MTELQQLAHFLEQPLVWKSILGYWLVSAAVDAMPDPGQNKWYRFLYTFSHGVAGNAKRALSALKVPGA